MALTREDLEQVKAIVSAMLGQQPPPPVAQDAIAIDGSYDPTDGTITAKYGDTDTMFPDTGDQAALPTRIELATTQLGDQYGARGNERVVLVPAQGGPVALIIHGPDDSPGAPAGERWIAHYNAAGEVDSYIKHTNDGPTPGDGLGGAHYGGNAALTQATTKGGHVIAGNDTAKTLTATSAGGHSVELDDNSATQGVKTTSKGGLFAHLDDVLNQIRHEAGANLYTIVDAAGNAISHVVGTGGLVGLGGLASAIPSTGALARYTELADLISGGSWNTKGLNQLRLDDLEKFAAAMVAAGVPNAGAVIGLLASLIPINVAPCSAIVRSL